MAILTPNDVGPFLGIPVDAPGLPEAISQAEDIAAGELGLGNIEYGEHTEDRVLMYPARQVLTKYGPVHSITSFTLGGDDYTNDVVPTDWSIMFRDGRGFERMSLVEYVYTAGWTDAAGPQPIPSQVASYIKSMAGLTYDNLLASGVVEAGLGDMRIEIDRAALIDNVEPYRKALRAHSRPY